MLKAALNGDRDPREHDALPVSVGALAEDAAACVAAGAHAVHLHPRDEHGRETLDGAIVDATVIAVRARCEVPVGVSTGAWIEPDLDRRCAAVAAWTAPDFASVNLSEDGADRVMDALARAGIGIEAGVWSVADVERLAAIARPGRHWLVRVLIELIDVAPADVDHEARAIHAALDERAIVVPRLQHGEHRATWPTLADAVAHGLDTRIGLEDTLELPDGTVASGNRALVEQARALGAR